MPELGPMTHERIARIANDVAHCLRRSVLRDFAAAIDEMAARQVVGT